MAAQWESKNICTGYNFEDSPDVNSVHNVPREYWNAYETNLAFFILTDFGKEPSVTLAREQSSSFSALVSGTARVERVSHSRRQPLGSGNRYNFHQKYYQPLNRAPNNCNTVRMKIGEIQTFTEHFDSYLQDSETVASYTITANDGLSIQSSSLSTPDVNYTIKAEGTGTSTSEYLRLQIQATTSTGRIEIRTINFQVTDASITS